jgi:hypothetical protein
MEVLEADGGLLLLGRGDHLVAVNTGDLEVPLPAAGGPVLESEPGAAVAGRLAGHAGAVLKRQRGS